MEALHPNRQEVTPGKPTRFVGLRIKFVVFFSLILIMTCSSLSWYFIETRRTAMTDNLEELGSILLTNTVRNEHFRIAGVVLEDRIALGQFMQSLMAIDHVVYVIITAPACAPWTDKANDFDDPPMGHLHPQNSRSTNTIESHNRCSRLR